VPWEIVGSLGLVERLVVSRVGSRCLDRWLTCGASLDPGAVGRFSPEAARPPTSVHFRKLLVDAWCHVRGCVLLFGLSRDAGKSSQPTRSSGNCGVFRGKRRPQPVDHRLFKVW
jgi:hypothetical protein